MNRLVLFIISAVALLCGNVCYAEVICTTHTYAVKDGKELKLDAYIDNSLKSDAKRPVFIYSFGGGWEGGTRKDAKWIKRFAENGFLAVCIDYRLGIKELKDKGQPVDGANFGNAYSYAIGLGVKDLYDATRYIVDNAGNWNADIEKVIISGGGVPGRPTVLWRNMEYATNRNFPKHIFLPDSTMPVLFLLQVEFGKLVLKTPFGKISRVLL